METSVVEQDVPPPAAKPDEPPLMPNDDGDAPPPPPPPPDHPPGRSRFALLCLAALGIVYGDIGTSPLYTIRECFSADNGLAPVPANVYGVLSLLVWAILFVVALKYIVFVLRADNRGEGGILALMALAVREEAGKGRKRRVALVLMGLFGAALLYGDGIITPPISVLGAMEGLIVVAPHFERFVVPAAFAVLLGLFLVQRKGTQGIGSVFGPVIAVWFVTIGTLGAAEIVREPRILLALNPWYGARFFLDHGFGGLGILGAVVLAITGAEALYADMGHFGKTPIRLVFFCVVLPGLLLNYFGQGALVLRDPSAVENPFFRLAPRVLLYPLIGISTLAAVVASQALISGAFSLTQQAVQLGYIPRVRIVHTSSHEPGQIYVPEVNFLLMIGCLLLVLIFESSDALASAYGIAVTGTMVITSILFAVVARKGWGWPVWAVASLTTAFLVVDLAFFGANATKIVSGGWVPLLLAAVLLLLMTTWKRGREVLGEIFETRTMPLELLLKDLERPDVVCRVAGTAVFMTGRPGGTPTVLMHHLKHNKSLQKEVVVLSVKFADVPYVGAAEAVEVERLSQGFYRVVATFGFMDETDVPASVMGRVRQAGASGKPGETSYYLGRENLIVTGRPGMARWRKYLFAAMSTNARTATEYFNLPPGRVVEVGAQIEF